MKNSDLYKQVKKRSEKIVDTKGFDPRKTVLTTDDDQTCDIFKTLLPEEFELFRLRDVNFCGTLPRNRTSLVDETIRRALKVHEFMCDQGEPYTVIAETTVLKVYYDEKDHPSVYWRPETTEETCTRLLAELANKSELKATASCVLAIVPVGESTNKIWTCAGAAHGKIVKEWGGIRQCGQARYSTLEGHFAVDKLDGRTLAEATIDEYAHYSHYGRAILHMLERFPYGY